MIHLYIDTNAYLTFFHLTSDDLEEVKKLLLIITKTKDVQLLCLNKLLMNLIGTERSRLQMH